MLQGERQLARDNRTLGKFQLVGLPPAPRGVPQIEVTFDIDANGIVNVTAKDKATGKEQKITITGSSGLSKDDVDKMVRDAEAHAADDKARREVIDARNQADSLAWSVEKTLNENRDKVPVERDRDASRRRSRRCARPSRATTRRRSRARRDELQKASHAMAEALYKAQQAAAPSAGQPAGSAAGSTAAEGEVVDAEFAETK